MSRTRAGFAATVTLLLLAGCGTNSSAPPAAEGPEPGQVAKRISLKEAYQLVQRRKDDQTFVILDVRTPEEYGRGHIPRAVNMNYYASVFKTELDKLDKSHTYLIHCAVGGRSAKVLQLMTQMRFQEVYEVKAGFRGWHAAGYPTTQ